MITDRDNIGNKSNRLLSMAVPAIVGIGLLMMMLAEGDVADDFTYRRYFTADGTTAENVKAFHNCVGEPIESLSDAAESAVNHYVDYNGRLSSLLMFFFALLPEWSVDIFNAVMVVVMLLAMLKITFGRKALGNAAGAVAVSASAAWVLPWGGIFLSDAYMNYVWSAAANLFFVGVMLRIPGFLQGSGKSSRLKAIGMAVAGIAVGQMHEAFSPAVCAGLAVMIIERRREILGMPRQIAGIAGYFVGTAVVLSSPALWNRVAVNPWTDAGTMQIISELACHLRPLLVLMAVLLLNRLMRNRLKTHGADDDESCRLKASRHALTAMMLVSYMIGAYLWMFERVVWLGDTLAIVMIWQTVFSWKNIAQRTAGRGGRVFAILFVVAVGFEFVQLTLWQARFADEHKRILTETDTDGSNIIYTSLPAESEMKWWLFGKPYNLRADRSFSEYMFFSSVSHGRHERHLLLQEKYRGVAFDSLPAVEGTAGIRGEYPVFYSAKRLNNPRQLCITFADTSAIDFFASRSPVYLLPRLKAELTGIDRVITGVYETKEYPAVVSPEMRRRGICAADTAWFYRVMRIGRSARDCQIVRIDTVG